MAEETNVDLTLIPGRPSSKALAALIKKFTGKDPDPVRHAAAMERISAAFEKAWAAKEAKKRGE